MSEDLNGTNIIAIPLDSDEKICVGYIYNKYNHLSKLAQSYIKKIRTLYSFKCKVVRLLLNCNKNIVKIYLKKILDFRSHLL